MPAVQLLVRTVLMVSFLYLEGLCTMATGDSGEETEEDVPALHAAAEDNDIDAARKLLERQDVTVGVNEFWESETPLHICCRLGHSRLAAILLDHGANPDYLTDNRQETPLFLASREGHLEVVKLLVEKGGCLHGNVDVGLDALYVASVCGSAAVLRYLIQEGVVFEEHHPPHGHTPLTCACRHGRKEIVQELISAGCDVNKPMDNGHSGVFLAAMFQFADIVRLLVQAQAEVNDYSVQFQGCPLHMACRNKDIGTVQALLGAADCDVDVIQDEGQTPLYIAAGLGELDIVETLIGSSPLLSENICLVNLSFLELHSLPSGLEKLSKIAYCTDLCAFNQVFLCFQK